jgi:hypothetical protein
VSIDVDDNPQEIDLPGPVLQPRLEYHTAGPSSGPLFRRGYDPMDGVTRYPAPSNLEFARTW